MIPARDIQQIISALADRTIPENFAGKTVLVTGARGFLGRWVLEVFAHLNGGLLRRQPVTVLAVDTHANEAEARELRALPGVQFFHQDLLSGLWPRDRLSHIFHLAGIASPYWYRKEPLLTFDVAVTGARQCLELAKRDNARLIFTSSSEVYQTPPDDAVPTPESYVGAIAPDNDRSCYDVSKLAAETLAHIYWKQYGVNAVRIRIFNAFGPGLAERDHRIMARVGSALKGRRALQIYMPKSEHGGPMPTRTYCYAANTVLGLFLALLRGGAGEVYNIGVTEPELSVLDLANRIYVDLDLPLRWDLHPAPDVYEKEPMRRCPDISRAQRDLDYAPIVNLDEGLKRFLAWTQENYTGNPDG